MSVEKIAQYISEQVRKERAMGFRPLQDVTEAREGKPGALKHTVSTLNSEVDSLHKALKSTSRIPGEHKRGQRNIATARNHKPGEVHKTLTGLGYKKEKPEPYAHDQYTKTDKHGYTHRVSHDGKHVMHHEISHPNTKSKSLSSPNVHPSTQMHYGRQ